MSTRLRTFTRVMARVLAVIGAATLALCAWLMTGWSTGLEWLVIETHEPRPARAIVCLTAGFGSHTLPSHEGWKRIYTSVQLLADGLAPVIIFSGGGIEPISEAEAYAEAARWLGAPAGALLIDPVPGSTADHPRTLLAAARAEIRRDTPLLIVTSVLHSKRAAMCFRKAGYTDARIVTGHEASRGGVSRAGRRSEVRSFAPNGKTYADPINRLRWGLDDLLMTLREMAGIVVYRLRGDA